MTYQLKNKDKWIELIELERINRQKSMIIYEKKLIHKGFDLFSNEREMLTRERAEKLIEEKAKIDLNEILAIRLGTKSFGIDAAEVFHKKIKQMEKITCADLSDIIAGRPELEALVVLEKVVSALNCKSLKVLNLSDNALGEKGIRVLESALSSIKSLEEIEFKNNGLSDLSIELLSNFLPTDNLRLLHFHNNMSGAGGAIAAASIISKSPKLEDFQMSSSRVDAKGGLFMIRALIISPENLLRLDFSDSMFNKECTEVLVSAIPRMKFLTDLVIRDSGFDKSIILKALSEKSNLPELSILDISGIEIDTYDGAILGNIIRIRKRLQKLWMDDNELESEGIINFCKMAYDEEFPTMLEYISASSCQIDQKGAYSLAKFSLLHKTLKKINLYDNPINISGVNRIQALLDSKGKSFLFDGLESMFEDDTNEEDLSDNSSYESNNDLDDLTRNFRSL